MKAIQVLKNCLKYSDYGNDIEEKEYIRKAIAELEVIQDIILEKDEALDIERLLFKNKLESLENRNCDGCKYYLSDNGNYPLEPCGECSRWYSDRWESKQ